MGEEGKLPDIFGCAIELSQDIHKRIVEFELLYCDKGKGEQGIDKIDCEALSSLAKISSDFSRIFVLCDRMNTAMANPFPYRNEWQYERRMIIREALSLKSRLQKLVQRVKDQGLLQEKDYIFEHENITIQDIEEAEPQKTWLQKLDDLVAKIAVMVFVGACAVIPTAHIINKHFSLSFGL